jgi:uncharacterized membrane protein
MAYILQNLHFIFIHFPIALLIVSFLFDFFASVLKKKELHTAGLITLIFGTIGAIASVLTGPEEERNPLLHLHENFAHLTMILYIVLSIVRLGLLWWKKREIGRNPVFLVVSLAGVLLVSYTGHLGGEMVHKPRNGNFQERGSFQDRGNGSGTHSPQGRTGNENSR